MDYKLGDLVTPVFLPKEETFIPTALIVKQEQEIVTTSSKAPTLKSIMPIETNVKQEYVDPETMVIDVLYNIIMFYTNTINIYNK